MFEEPPAKRVRRDELFAASPGASSRSNSPAAQDGDVLQHIDYGFEYEIVDTASTNKAQRTQERQSQAQDASSDTNHRTAHDGTTQQQQQQQQQSSPQASKEDGVDEDDGLEFRLFLATTSKPKSESKTAQPTVPNNGDVRVQKIRIRSPTPLTTGDGEGGFVNPHRKRGYYFTFMTSGDGREQQQLEDEWRERKPQFDSVAVSGSDVMDLARLKWPGTNLPWRIIPLSTTTTTTSSPSANHQPPLPPSTPSTPLSRKPRCRPSKKRRIVLRTRAQQKISTEQAEREKRTRKNREKKVKKKMRDKAKKEEADVEVEGKGEVGEVQSMDVDGIGEN